MNAGKGVFVPIVLALAVFMAGCAGTSNSYIKEIYATIASVAEVVNATMAALDDLYTEGQLSQETADTAASIHSKYRATHIAMSTALEHYARLPREGQGIAPIAAEELLSRLLVLAGELQTILMDELMKKGVNDGP